MKEKQLMKGAAFMLLAATAIPPAHAQLKTNAGVQYLLSQPKDMSQDFLDLSNTYFFADSLVSFDTSTGKGTVQWKRQQLMPRQAFNANTYLHQPLQSLDFPETAYDNNPQLTFTVEPVRTYPPHPYAYLAHRTERRCRRPHAHRKACRRTLLLESREDR